jgi:hypothetical protein
MSGRIRLIAPVLASLAVVAATGTAAWAGPVQDPVAVQPDTLFAGLVNGTSSPAAIRVACGGPVTAGETTHPLAGQTVEADTEVPTSTAPLGYTGSAGTAIEVSLTPATTAGANAPIKLGFFFAPVAIPTTWNVPCSGTGTLSFVPLPTSPTARTLNLTVTFENIALD